MKFRMINLSEYKVGYDYPYDYRIELTEYDLTELESMHDWLNSIKIRHTSAGHRTGSVVYLYESDAILFQLRWS